MKSYSHGVPMLALAAAIASESALAQVTAGDDFAVLVQKSDFWGIFFWDPFVLDVRRIIGLFVLFLFVKKTFQSHRPDSHHPVFLSRSRAQPPTRMEF